MFAIVEVGGKQYRVEEGGQVVVDRLDAAEGATVELRAILVADGTDLRFAGEGKKTRVTADVVEHLRGPKITISRFKPKRGWRKKTGFRSALTRLELFAAPAPRSRDGPAHHPRGRGGRGASRPSSGRSRLGRARLRRAAVAVEQQPCYTPMLAAAASVASAVR